MTSVQKRLPTPWDYRTTVKNFSKEASPSGEKMISKINVKE
jgi:hypothetical protein